MENNISTIGNLTIDDIILYDTKKMFLESVGGNALFSAIGANIWGGRPRIYARIGRSFPKEFAEQIKQYGIDSNLVRVTDNDIRDWALYEPGGARQFINHLSSGNHYQMSITSEELPPDCLMADGIHVASMPTDVQFGLIKHIYELNKDKKIISWDPHVDYLSEPSHNKMAYMMLEMVDLFLPSREEVIAMCGIKDVYTAIKDFVSHGGPRVIAIKMSTDGSLVYSKEDEQFYHIPIFKSNTIDPTGAGDSYCGGFLNAYIETGDAILSACYGTVSASYVVEHIGALNTFQSNFSDKEERLEVVKRNIKKI
jgi:ribokinase